MDYGITTLAGPTTPFLPIGESKFKSIKRAKAGLLDCRSIEEKFDFVVESYLEFEESILHSALANLTSSGKHDDHWWDRDRALFNSRLATLLTAAVTYRDGLKRDAPRVLVSREYADVKKAFEEELQKVSRLGFRAMFTLRNYVQHIDFPINSVAYSGRLDRKPSGNTIVCDVQPRLTAAEIDIGSIRKADKQVVEELQGLGKEPLLLTPLVKDGVEGIWVVHSLVREKISPKIMEWRPLLEAARAKFLEKYTDLRDGVPVAAVARNPDGSHETGIHLISRVDSYRQYLEAKNDNLNGIASRYIASQPKDGKR